MARVGDLYSLRAVSREDIDAINTIKQDAAKAYMHLSRIHTSVTIGILSKSLLHDLWASNVPLDLYSDQEPYTSMLVLRC